MKIEDFEIKIKKYDEKKNVVYVNLIVFRELELRNWVVRYTETRYSSLPIWIVNPPSSSGRNKKMFWIVYLKNITLWKQVQNKIINKVKEYTNAL